MQNLHSQTNHSYKSIQMNPFFLDWRTQPKKYKNYPKFHMRFKIDEIKELVELDLVGGVTFQKSYIDDIFTLHTNPSAGGLYPCEVYFQIRGVEGLLEGIYHYERNSKSLVLLYELSDDGVEHYFRDKIKQKGVIALISSVYFRSSWKYRDRALRYTLLDSGHQLGSIYAAFCVMERVCDIAFDFDKLTLNELFGFRNDEMFTVSISSSLPKERVVKPLRLDLPYVCGCDYLFANSFIEDGYKQSAIFEDKRVQYLNFFKKIEKDRLKSAILNRRSIRAFRGNFIEKDEFLSIVEDIFQFASTHNIEIYYTSHRVKGLENGLYKKDKLMVKGDFSKKSQHLSLNQSLGGDGAVTFYFTSNEIKKYQKVNILSGFLAHIIYIKCELHSIGCSGIGAYYDKEVQLFLQTQNSILYLVAIGRWYSNLTTS